MTKIRWWSICGALGLAALAGCATSPAPAPVDRPAAASADLTTLDRLMQEAGLAQTLPADRPYTLFAPSDAAFKALPPATMEALRQDKAQLRAVLSSHLVPGKLAGAELGQGKLKTLQGHEIATSRAGDFVTIEEALVTRADLPARNGVIHVIDRVLLPAKK